MLCLRFKSGLTGFKALVHLMVLEKIPNNHKTEWPTIPAGHISVDYTILLGKLRARENHVAVVLHCLR